MPLLKGIERCEYISKVMDDINHLVWVKDKDNNLIFANSLAFDFFKKMSKNDSIKCPIEINGYEENKTTKIQVEENDMWLQYSSMPIFTEGSSIEGTLVIATDVTERRIKTNQVSRIIDSKIDEWKKEQEIRALRLERNNKEMYEMLNLDINGAMV
jgi:hypothetical protein